MKLTIPSPVVKIDEKLFHDQNVEVHIKRDDLIHPVISGNKWRKLKYNLKAAGEGNYKTILTFGGAFSNHIAAVARASRENGFRCIGIIRGEKSLPLNNTLEQSQQDGMVLHFISRSEYNRKEEPDFMNGLDEKFGDFYLVPEGGGNTLGVKGCIEMAEEISGFTQAVVAVGTGTTLAGLSLGFQGQSVGIAVLKGEGYLEDKVNSLLNTNGSQWKIVHDYTFGGFAKYKADLISFINNFSSQHKIQLDPIYTGKMMFGLYDLINKGFFPAGSKILAIHSGGLQGITGFNHRFGNLIDTTLSKDR